MLKNIISKTSFLSRKSLVLSSLGINHFSKVS